MKLHHSFVSTLERISLVKVATMLWNTDDIRNRLTSENFKLHSCEVDTDPSFTLFDRISGNYDSLRYDPFSARSERMRVWQKIESMVTEKALSMLLSESTKVKLVTFIKPIGLEILKWIENHVEVKYLATRLPSEFFWTSHGTIDRKKTAAALIKDEKIDITKRYKLACIYCLEDDIKILRDKIYKHHIMFEVCRASESCFEYSELVHIWDCILKGKIANLPNVNKRKRCTPFQYAFEHAAVYGHKSATEYFFQKLRFSEQKQSLVRISYYVMDKRHKDDALTYGFAKEYHADVLRFLLSHMDNQQLREVLRKPYCFRYVLLECCLDWPWQGFLLETALCVQEFLSESDYEKALYFLIKKIINGFKDCNYQKLFRELFQLIPETNLTYFHIDRTGKFQLALPASLLPYLFGIKDKELISLILKDATATEKEKIIFSKHGLYLCIQLACNNGWDLVGLLLTECIATPEKLIKFRGDIRKAAAVIQRKAAEEKISEPPPKKCNLRR